MATSLTLHYCSVPITSAWKTHLDIFVNHPLTFEVGGGHIWYTGRPRFQCRPQRQQLSKTSRVREWQRAYLYLVLIYESCSVHMRLSPLLCVSYRSAGYSEWVSSLIILWSVIIHSGETAYSHSKQWLCWKIRGLIHLRSHVLWIHRTIPALVFLFWQVRML